MIMYLIFFFLSFISLGQTAILQCNFETPCNDFILDRNWGITDGLHPSPIDHDHTLNTNVGHYLFFSPQSSPKFQFAEIKTNSWLRLPNDRAVCFQMWYYTPQLDFPFSVQLIQGDDQQLIRIAASIPGKDPSINDWTQIKITLPAEQLKVFIRLNFTSGSLAFDDLLVDYCDEPLPQPSKTLFSCDFESSCSDQFISLSNYPYQWSIIQANDAIKKESDAPAVDYTFSNSSGHYAWLANYNLIEQGKVGYLAMKTPITITSDESFCLNFYYYFYGRTTSSNLLVYSWTSDSSNELQVIWPDRKSGYATYTKDKWTWGIINLPVGVYTILFRMDSTDIIQSSFALDNIKISSCAYPPQLLPYNLILSFSCNFDDLTMCNMKNTDDYAQPSFNFTVVTGDTVPNRELGPNHDHTTNSSSGGFVYWNRQLPFISGDTGFIRPDKRIEQNLGMCVRFAYYVKSLAVNKNATKLILRAGGCYGKEMWIKSVDDSLGWQVVTIPVERFACMENFYFRVSQIEPIPVSVAFDDIEIAQCPSFDPTTTTTTTTTTVSSTVTTQTTTISTITSTSTMATTKITSPPLSTTSQMSTTTTTIVTSHTSSYKTSTPNNAMKLISMKYICLISFCFLKVISKVFLQ